MTITSYRFRTGSNPPLSTSQNREPGSFIWRAGRANSAPNKNGAAATRSMPSQYVERIAGVMSSEVPLHSGAIVISSSTSASGRTPCSVVNDP